jgi:hypothetical protein
MATTTPSMLVGWNRNQPLLRSENINHNQTVLRGSYLKRHCCIERSVHPS